MTRYASGEEPMVGDEVDRPHRFSQRGGPGIVSALKCDRLRTTDMTEHETRVDPYPWAVHQCTLIRRAEKPEQCSCVCHTGAFFGVDHSEPCCETPGARRTRLASAPEDAGAVLESFLRALAKPTLAERYAEFLEKVKAALFKFSVFDVEGTTDLLSDGFLLRLRVGTKQTTMSFVDEPGWLTVSNFVANAVASEADRIGREALKKR